MACLKKRGKRYYIQYYVGRKQKRLALGIESYQIAKEKLRQFESAQFKGEGNPLPTKTPLDKIITRYVEHIRNIKTEKREHHEYLLYLALEDIDHSKTKARSPQTNGMYKRFHKTMQDEFYAVTFHKKLYTTLDELQRGFDKWMN